MHHSQDPSRQTGPVDGERASASPARAVTPRVDVHVRRVVARAGVESHAAGEVGMLVLDLFHGASDDHLVAHGNAPIAVGVDDDVRGVAILMAAIARRTLYAGVMRRCAE